MSGPQQPYGELPPAPFSPYPGDAPASGHPQQSAVAQQSKYTPIPTPPMVAATTRNPLVAGLIASLAGTSALIGFFLLPFYSISGGGNTLSVKAPTFTKDGYTVTGASVKYVELWVVVGAAIAIIAVGAIVAFGLKTASRGKVRGVGLALIGLGLVAAGILLYVDSDYTSKVSAALNTIGPASAFSGVSHGFAMGFWVCLLGCLVAAGAGVATVVRAKK